jgi:hypothetical protein
MMLMSAPQASAWAGLIVAAGAVSWQAAVLTLAALAGSGVLRLLAEWQRRKTFLTLIGKVPEGTIVEQQDTLEGRSMRVSLGSSASRPPSAGT